MEKKQSVRQDIFIVLSNPTIAYILLLIGLAGSYFEFSTPGVIFPGVIGGMSLVLSLFALQTLSIKFAGVALIVLALLLFILEIKIISHGILTIGGVVSLIMGSLLLYYSSVLALQLSLIVFLPALITIVLFFVAVIRLAIKAQVQKKMLGADGLVGCVAVATTDISGKGMILVDGEYWSAIADTIIPAGSKVIVQEVCQQEGDVKWKESCF